jgi:NedA-like, galactose-binding domain
MRESLQRLKQRWTEPLWQKQAERVAAGHAPEQRARLRELSRAARRRADAALELRDDRSVAAAMALTREASALAITALLVARREHSVEGALEAPEAWSRLSALIDAGELGEPPDELSVARPLLAESDVLAVDRVDAAQARKARAAAETTLQWLLARFEARSVRRIQVSRVLRVGGVATALGVLLTAAVVHALRPTDIALHKPVVESSHRFGTPEASGAVDGDKSGTLGFHTNLQDRPWLRIDLERRYAISKIVVYNRGDGWFDEILPLAVELSDDGHHFHEVAVRKRRFTAAHPWVINLRGKSGRFVRLRLKKRGFLWGSEVEVFGHED